MVILARFLCLVDFRPTFAKMDPGIREGWRRSWRRFGQEQDREAICGWLAGPGDPYAGGINSAWGRARDVAWIPGGWGWMPYTGTICAARRPVVFSRVPIWPSWRSRPSPGCTSPKNRCSKAGMPRPRCPTVPLVGLVAWVSSASAKSSTGSCSYGKRFLLARPPAVVLRISSETAVSLIFRQQRRLG